MLILEILLAVLAAGLIALAVAVARLSGRVRRHFQEDSDDLPDYAERQARSASGEARASAAPEAQSGIPGGGSVPGEIVAAIAAAVCCLEPGAVVTSVRRAPQNGVSSWKMAGLLENTKPFF